MIAIDARIEAALQRHANVALGLSGGKDSAELAYRTVPYLRERGHRGEIIGIHSDLGSLEWDQSLPQSQAVADHVGIPLVTVKAPHGGMMGRWRYRWESNVERYTELSCVMLILPWSTPSMRFCTSEMKVAVICKELVRRWPNSVIISASGVRRAESKRRQNTPISAENDKLCRVKAGTVGYDWCPILFESTEDIIASYNARPLPGHEAYTMYGTSRVSCRYCILASFDDLLKSTTCEANQDVYRELVDLELESTFSFQEKQWLLDVAPWLLTPSQQLRVAETKERAAARVAAEKRIPKHLHYTREGWPQAVPTKQEAALLADVRRIVLEAVRLPLTFVDADEIIERYEDLIAKRDGVNRAQLSLF